VQAAEAAAAAAAACDDGTDGSQQRPESDSRLSPEPDFDSRRVMGQMAAVADVLEGAVSGGRSQGRRQRKARETKEAHAATKVASLVNKPRKQHERDREMEAMTLPKRQSSSFVPASTSRSQRQSSFKTLDTGVFFANVETGPSPEAQGYQGRLQSF
jgi:hypothetical protein